MSFGQFKILLIFALFGISFQFFGKDSKVIQLNHKNFKKKVVQSKNLWLILFYAPWCGHCQEFHPEFEKIAQVTKGLFKIGAVNCEKEEKLADKFRIQGFPTLIFLGENKKRIEEYQGDRDAKKIIEFLFKKAKKIASKKLKSIKDVKTDL